MPEPAPKPRRAPSGLARLFLGLLLAAAAVFVFAPTLKHGFVNYDDDTYVYENAHVLRGFEGGGLSWSLTATDQANWHPLTWMSLMLDSELHGLRKDAPPFSKSAPGFHATNLLLHVASTILLFLLLARLTGAFWRSAFVAALFGVHPLHVESVAWVAERKDVLSTLFGVLATWAYVAYAEKRGLARYGLVVLLFVASLASKPMLVTLPVLFLLLDFGVLDRRSLGWRRLVLEKAPMLVLVAASAAVTIYAQRRGGAFRTFESVGLGIRVANAAVASIAYLVKMVWPTRLAVFYPHPGANLETWKIAASSIALVGISWISIRKIRELPYVAFGWAWYLVSILPVIGLVQVGAQAMADRYTYVPLIGPFIAVAWGIADAAGRALGERRASAVLAGAAAVVLGVLALVARAQVAFWKDSETLFRHALLCTNDDNTIAHNNLGLALLYSGRLDESVPHFQSALRVRPAFVDARVNLGSAFLMKGRLGEAEFHLQEAIRLDPRSAGGHTNLGVALALGGKFDEAIGHLRTAVDLEPDNVQWKRNLERAQELQRGEK